MKSEMSTFEKLNKANALKRKCDNFEKTCKFHDQTLEKIHYN